VSRRSFGCVVVVVVSYLFNPAPVRSSLLLKLSRFVVFLLTCPASALLLCLLKPSMFAFLRSLDGISESCEVLVYCAKKSSYSLSSEESSPAPDMSVVLLFYFSSNASVGGTIML